MFKSYSKLDTDISLAGINVDGWESLSLSRNEANTTRNTSADGVHGITVSADKSGMLELEVIQQNAPVNRAMAALQAEQDRTGDVIYFDIVISEKSSGVLTYQKNCYLDVPASQDLSTDAGSRTWAFFVTNMQFAPDVTGKATTEAAEALAFVNTLKNNTANR